ncbi:RhoGAP-domain-containing protein [Neolentinus lepideus HHB14362 ss-1]|uniref:RhoGAP-domain-containing protein n=1 Tax=Neolentinus lepideus HHB14362 ss-1 TaxID=1314782 RepID=A0A165U846_9AGAM|nr:RhoGAP-domain-containing protein [Neolentinus lepideus HHB14362 ss-1]
MPTSSASSSDRLRPSDSASSSTTVNRLTQSTSNANLHQVHSTVTLEAALAPHANAPSPHLAALEQILMERNNISSQNAQLWKLIEKQRAAYNQVLKEVDRLRSERDAYKSRLQGLGESTELLGRRVDKERSLRTSPSNSKLKARGDEADLKVFKNNLDMPAPSKHRTHKSSRSQEVSRKAERKNSHDELNAPPHASTTPSRPQIVVPGRPEPDPSSSASPTDLPYAFGSDPSLPLDARIANIQPLAVPPRSSSITASINSFERADEASPPSVNSNTDVQPPVTASPPPLTTSPPIAQQTGALVPPIRPAALSRESQISLPDEARRYIVSMATPVPSPQIGTFTNQHERSESPAQLTPEPVLGPRDPSPLSNGHGRPPTVKEVDEEFLDMGDEESTSASDAQPDRESPQNLPEATPTASTHKARAPVPAVEDFPLPPSSRPEPYTPTQATDTVSYRSQTLSDASSAHVPGPTFRALPLLPHDLPYTRVHVSHSSIRPNERGKEVLSFVISVEPGKTKEPWKVEKLFSDVLMLDQRVRASVGKSATKKIASLPDGKLWRDRAPVKVDQRKAALENYLQSLINLPVKNKNEVIAFFTSDIVRDTKKPVLQHGYKEGYLTKRGKNFGGWKLRYFVLQGPVLEYYESRGGAHLGSITITGAQIGRQQQKTGAIAESDAENEYRHAFLIIEAKKGPTGSSARHVLCAESDDERDSWVEVLVRYVMGAYDDSPGGAVSGGQMTAEMQGGPSRPSTSSEHSINFNAASSPISKRPRAMSKDDIAKGPAVPLSQLPPDAGNAKLFQNIVPVQTLHVDESQIDDTNPISSSLPTGSGSALDSASETLVEQRSNSELGHYNDLHSMVRPGNATHDERLQQRQRNRQSLHPSLTPLKSSSPNHNTDSPERPTTPEAGSTPKAPEINGKMKISGPLGGAPIPEGFKFGGGKSGPDTTPSSSDRREKAKSRTFWGFSRPHAEKPANVPAYVSRAVFGVPIEEALDVAQIANLPAIAFRCIEYLQAKKADQEEGIYRLSGSSAEIKALKDRFNTEGDVDLLGSGEYWDPHAIAGLFKTYLRELPTSILTRDLHLKFLAVMDFVDPQERIDELSRLIAALPIANYSLLRALTAHLILIVQNSSVNKMTMRNVGIVFSPTLAIPAGVFSLMLGEFNRVFNVNGDQATPVEEATPAPAEATNFEPPAGLSRRNSRQYADAAADQLLGLSKSTLEPPPEEGNSDDEEELSIHDESGNETTENEATVESVAPSTPPQYQEILHEAAEDDDVGSSTVRSRASTLAAGRGLSIQTDARGRRHSRVMGLPRSPRPGGQSPHTPIHDQTTPISPMHTPR